MMPLLYAIIKSTRGDFTEALKLIQEGNQRLHSKRKIESGKNECESSSPLRNENGNNDTPIDLSTHDYNLKRAQLPKNLSSFHQPWVDESSSKLKANTFNVDDLIDSESNFKSEANCSSRFNSSPTNSQDDFSDGYHYSSDFEINRNYRKVITIDDAIRDRKVKLEKKNFINESFHTKSPNQDIYPDSSLESFHAMEQFRSNLSNKQNLKAS